jgi:hypothetical protein
MATLMVQQSSMLARLKSGLHESRRVLPNLIKT